MTTTQIPPHDFFSRADMASQRVAITMADTGAQHAAGDIADRARVLAQWLTAAQTLRVGEMFAVLLENRVEVLELVLAARLAGLYAVVLSTHLSAAEVAYIVKDCRPRLVIGSNRTWPQLQQVTGLQEVVLWSVEDPGDDDTGASSMVSAMRETVGAPLVDFSDRPLGCDLLYSSGTTGHPKGVLKPTMPPRYRHEPVPEIQVTARHFHLDEQTIYLSPAPLYHAAPLRYTLRVLDTGGQAVIMGRFDAEQALALIERYRVTHSQWVPAMFQRMLQLPENIRLGHDLSSHRVAIHAAAPCPVPLKQAMLDWWGDILFEYYAGSEGCGTTMITSAEWRQRPGSVGRAISGHIHILDDEGEELPAGEVGNIYFSGGGQFAYLNDEDKTRQAINDKGWATYGDVGHVDEAGYLYLSDRRADLIISGGVNLYPQEIENALRQHPAVDELAVVGVPHEDLGEQPLAVMVLKPGEQPSQALAQAIVGQAAQALGRIKLPQRVAFVDKLPRLPTGKLLRRKLKESYKQDADVGFSVSRDAGTGTSQTQQGTVRRRA